MASPHGIWDPNGLSERSCRWEQTLKRSSGAHPPLLTTSPAPTGTGSVLTPGPLQRHLHTGARDKGGIPSPLPSGGQKQCLLLGLSSREVSRPQFLSVPWNSSSNTLPTPCLGSAPSLLRPPHRPDPPSSHSPWPLALHRPCPPVLPTGGYPRPGPQPPAQPAPRSIARARGRMLRSPWRPRTAPGGGAARVRASHWRRDPEGAWPCYELGGARVLIKRAGVVSAE